MPQSQFIILMDIFFLGNLCIFLRTDLYIHNSVHTMFQYTKFIMQLTN